MSKAKHLGAGATMFAFAFTFGLAILAGCTSGVQSTPYGEEIKAPRKKKSPDANDIKSGGDDFLDDDVDNPNPQPTTTMAADAGVDSSTLLSNGNCSAQKGFPCEECCFRSIPGGTTLMAQMDSIFAQCAQQEQCGNNNDCLDFCNDIALDQGCASQSTLCNQLDACIAQNACYQ
jgi:hypothetical protein